MYPNITMHDRICAKVVGKLSFKFNLIQFNEAKNFIK